MKKRLPSILVGLLFLVGLGIMIYPTVSNQWNTYRPVSYTHLDVYKRQP